MGCEAFRGGRGGHAGVSGKRRDSFYNKIYWTDSAFDWAQSFAKNAGLYGERIGALHVIASNEEMAKRITSQLAVLQRSEISNPPSNGARIVSYPHWRVDDGCNKLTSVRRCR